MAEGADWLPGLFRALDIALFEELPQGTFRPVTPPPGWCLDFLADGTAQEAVSLEEGFAFLATFLYDAREFWADERPGRLRSEPWSEADRYGSQRQLQAYAVFHAERRLLFIERLGAEFEQSREILQRARQTALAYQRLGRLAAAVEASERDSRSVLRAVPDTLLRIHSDGTVDDYTDVEPAPRRTLYELLPPDAAERLLDAVGQALSARKTQTIDYATGNSDSVREWEARLAVCGPGEALALIRDVTTARAAEREIQERLRRSRRRSDELLTLLDELKVSAVIIDAAGCLSFISEPARRLCSTLDPEWIGRPWRELPCLDNQARRALERQASLPAAVREQAAISYSDNGVVRDLRATIRDHPREADSRVVLLTDVSEIEALRRQLNQRARFGRFIGKSAAMQRIYQLIDDLAQVDSTALIEGETGTGKELAARELHARSPRRGRPFVPVNCAGLTESLAASLLFGHKRGAYTGAIQDQKGYFEAADGGVLFLDEIGDVPASIQTSLLRALQEKEIVRLGETAARRVDVRVVAATNRNLIEEVRLGRFRADLLYRIRVTWIELPPLRERPDDIPLLAAQFLEDLRAATGKPVAGVSQSTLRALRLYRWPGNVREMRSALEFAVIRCRQKLIEPHDLPAEVAAALDPPPAAASERERVQRALAEAGGNRSRAAAILGVSRATFYRKLNRLKLSGAAESVSRETVGPDSSVS